VSQKRTHAAETELDGKTGWLWLFALAYSCLSADGAWSLAQYLWYLLNDASSSWSEFFWLMVTEIGPLASGIGLMTYLWKSFGSPFPQAPRKRPENLRGHGTGELDPPPSRDRARRSVAPTAPPSAPPPPPAG
jgi:hypothetical protein